MTYTDNYTFPTSHIIDSDFKTLRDAEQAKKPPLFAAYCKRAIALKASGTMPLRDAAYVIAGAMFIHDLEEPLFDEIVSLAGSLELPEHISGIQSTEGWERLTRLVDRYVQLHQ